ncbi:MarR family winged helix-turn-helix transcriptional regulator [Methanococcoides seepicolus]|uniref:MarR family transcriptional regulator n=1 Tax=Methanococcoides seepicolus TaxID=2828780 RepID=A0A9E4ZEU5_9EURY|nr:MarR family transcriptional regulator [Methanococcoides seepicolus]MCM1986281.1 MarR family transcriptional regulator [Methanococcoides seepicolus]
MKKPLSFEKVDKFYKSMLKNNDSSTMCEDVSFSSILYLREIMSLDKPTLSELASAMDVKKPSASNMVNKLVGKSLVKVIRSKDDRRVCRIELSPKGTEVVSVASSGDVLFFNKVRAILDDNEFEVFSGLWEKITSNLEGDGGK